MKKLFVLFSLSAFLMAGCTPRFPAETYLDKTENLNQCAGLYASEDRREILCTKRCPGNFRKNGMDENGNVICRAKK